MQIIFKEVSQWCQEIILELIDVVRQSLVEEKDAGQEGEEDGLNITDTNVG